MLRRQFIYRAFAAVPALAAAKSTFGADSGVAEPTSLGAITLEARNDWTTVAGRSAYLSLYNGLLPGPAIEARPGDTLQIDFKNSLSADTNVHFHGLHVSPAGIADNSFLEVPMNESIKYEVRIPADHPSGLFWYHPHMHGAVASQVSRGLAGLIIVRGEFDDQPEWRTRQSSPWFCRTSRLTLPGRSLSQPRCSAPKVGKGNS